MSNQVAVHLTGRESQLLDLIRQMNQGIDQGTEKIREQTREHKNLERQAKQVYDSTRTPLEQHNAQVEKLNNLRKAGVITEDTYNRALRKTRDEYSALGTQGSTTHGLLTRGVSSLVLQYTSLQGAIQAAMRAYREHQELQERAANESMSVAASQKNMLLNLGLQATPEERAEALRNAGEIARQSGIRENIFYQQYGATFSAMSGSYQQRAPVVNEVLRSLAPLMQGSQEDLGALAGASIDVKKAVPGMSADAAVAFMLTLQEQARVTSPDKLKHFVPALQAVAITSGGDRMRNLLEAGALFSGAGGALGDTEGPEAKTGVANFAAVLREMVPRSEGKTFGERLDMVVASAELQRKIIPELKGRGATKPVFEDLLRGGLVYQQYRDALVQFEGAGTSTEQLRRDVEGLTQEMRISTFEGTMGSEANALLRKREGVAGAVRRRLFTGSEEGPGAYQVLSGYTNRWSSRAIFEAELARGEDPIKQGVQSLRSLIAAQLTEKEPTLDLVRDPARLEAIKYIEQVITEVKALREVQEQQVNSQPTRVEGAVDPP